MQLAAVEAQIAAMRAQYSDTNPKTSEMRDLRDALEKQLNSVRSMRERYNTPWRHSQQEGDSEPRAGPGAEGQSASLRLFFLNPFSHRDTETQR